MARAHARLAVLGPSAQPLISRFTGDRIRVGRDTVNDLVLPDVGLSRRHAELIWDGTDWLLTDCGSRNGTLLNGRNVQGDERVEPGDRITLGGTTLVFDPPDTGLFRISTGPGTGRHEAAPLGRIPSSRGSVFIGDTAAARRVLEMVDRFAASDATVLITGENGTGKEIVANLLHQRSGRASGPWVVVNCPAVAADLVEAELFGTEKGVATGVDARPGRLEVADGGTLFLDEIADLARPAQAKMLRFLQDRVIERVGGRKPIRIDARIVAATNQDLHALSETGAFRRDLLHRLDVATIDLPPLRERREDIPALCDYFLGLHGKGAPRLSADALAVLMAHDWPGNVRELQHSLQRAVLLVDDGPIEPRDLPRTLRDRVPQRAAPAAQAGDEVLWHRIRIGGESFWDVVRTPYLGRSLARADVHSLVRRLHAESGGSYRLMAEGLGLSGEYRRFVDFLRHNGLRPED